MEHSRLLKFLKTQRHTPEMADIPTFKVQIDYQNPENVEAEVPGSQEIREVDNNIATSSVSEVTDGDYTLSPVITVTKNEATFTKGDMKLQKVTVTEDISIEESQNGKETKTSRTYHSSVASNGKIITQTASSKESAHEGTPKAEKQHEGRKSRIPMLRFKQTVEKVQSDRREQKRTEDAAEKRPRKSSIPKLRKETKLAVKKFEADHNSSNLPPEDEFEKIYEAIGDDKKKDIDDKVLAVKIDDPEKLESKFEELIHSYEEENHEENAYTRRTRISKIPALRRKNFDSDSTNRLSSLVNNIRLQNSVRNSREFPVENEFGEVITKTITTKRYSRAQSREGDKNLESCNYPDDMTENTFNKETKIQQVVTKTTSNTDADNIEQDAKTKEFITTERTDTIIGTTEQNEVINSENIITHITINPTVIEKDNSINVTKSSQTFIEINKTGIPVSNEVKTVTRTVSKTNNNLNDINQDSARSKVLNIERVTKKNSTYSNQEVTKFEKVTKIDTKDYYSVSQNDNDTDNREFITTETVIKTDVISGTPVASKVTITKIDDNNSNVNVIQDNRENAGIITQKSKAYIKMASLLLDKLTDVGIAHTKHHVSEEVTNVQVTEISKDKPEPTEAVDNDEITVQTEINPYYQDRIMDQDDIMEIIKTDITLKDDNKIDTLQKTNDLSIESDITTESPNSNKIILGTSSQVLITEQKEGIKIGIPRFTKEINEISSVSDKDKHDFDQNDEEKDVKRKIITEDSHKITTTFTQVLRSNNQKNVQDIVYKRDTKNNTTLDIKRDENTFNQSAIHKNVNDVFIHTNNMTINSEKKVEDETNGLMENKDRAITETTVLKGNVSRLINKLTARENQKETNTVNHERVRRLDIMISDFNKRDNKNIIPKELTEEYNKTQKNGVNTQATTQHGIENIVEGGNTQLSDNKIGMEVKDTEISRTYENSDIEKGIDIEDVSKLTYKKNFDINETISNEIDTVSHERVRKIEKMISDLNKIDYKKGDSKELVVEYVANEQGKDHIKTVEIITNKGYVADLSNLELKNNENSAFVSQPVFIKSHDIKEISDNKQIDTDRFIKKDTTEYAKFNTQEEDSNINVSEISTEKELLHTSNIVKEKGTEIISIKEELKQHSPTPTQDRDTDIPEDSLICGSVSRLITKITTVKSNEPNRTVTDFEEELPKKISVLSKVAIFEGLEPKEPYPKSHIQRPEKKLSQLVAKNINLNVKPRIVDEIVKDQAKSKRLESNNNDILALKEANETKNGTDPIIVNEYWKTSFSRDRKIQYISVSSLKETIDFENYNNKGENPLTMSNKNGALNTENIRTNTYFVTNEDNIQINDIPTENSEEIYARIKSKNDMYEQNAIEISQKLNRSESRGHNSTIYSYNVENTDELTNKFKFEIPISESANYSSEANVIEYFKNDNQFDREDKTREEFKRDKSLAETDLGDVIKGQVNKIISRINSVEFDKIDVLPRAEKISVKEMPRKCSVLEKIALFEGKAAAANIRISATGSAQKIIKKSSNQVMTEEMYQEKINELESAKARFGTIDEMPSITLGNGAKMPVIALGTALLDPRLLRHVVCTAIDLGYRAIDTAYLYGNETQIGESIKAKIDDGTVKREELFIISKLWSTYHRPDLVEGACKASLRNLGLSYFDLYLIHSPMSFKEGGDPVPKIATVVQYSQHDYLDAWFGMEKLLTKGLVKGIGISNFNSHQIQRILDKGRIGPVVNQVECHPYLSQRRLHEFCAARNITLSCYGALGSKGTPAEYKSTLAAAIDDPLVQVIAHGLNVTPAQLLIRYQIQSGHGVVVKSSTGAHLWDNLQALNFTLTDGQVEALHALNRNKRTFTFMGMGDTHKNYPFVTQF